MKKFTMITAFFLICCLFFGCQNSSEVYEDKPVFESDSQMKYALESGYWLMLSEDESSYKFAIFSDNTCTEYDFSYSGTTLANQIGKVLNELSNHDSVRYSNVYDMIKDMTDITSIPVTSYQVTYNAEDDEVVAIGQSTIWEIGSEIRITNNGTYIEVDSLFELENAFTEAIDNKVQIFLNKYPGIASYKDVVYDPYSYLGKNFSITGTVELDDFFNWEYYNKESTHFCLRITPTGGGKYTDGWYIYASRSSFTDLLTALKENGSCRMTLICKAEYENGSSHASATLVNYLFH